MSFHPRSRARLGRPIALVCFIGLTQAITAQTTFTIDLSPPLDPDGSSADGNLIYAIAAPSSTPTTLGTPADILGGPNYKGGVAGIPGNGLVDFNGSVTLEMPCDIVDGSGTDITVFGAQLDEDEGWDLFVGPTADSMTMTLMGSFAGSPSGQLNPESPLSVYVDFAGTPVPAGSRFLRMVKNEPDVGPLSFGFDYDAVGLPGVISQEVPRLGSPPNPAAFLVGTTSGPIVGNIWDPVIDHTSFAPGAFIDFVIVDLGPPINLPLAFGTLLCTPPPGTQTFFAAPGAAFGIAVPNDCSFAGLPACSQGGSVSAGPTIELANALDLVFGTD